MSNFSNYRDWRAFLSATEAFAPAVERAFARARQGGQAWRARQGWLSGAEKIGGNWNRWVQESGLVPAARKPAGV